MIYFISDGDNGPIKIGCSKNPAPRLKQLQTGNPRELRILGTIPGGSEVERKIHEQFAAHRIRDSAEWFECVPQITDFITRNCLQGKLNLVSLLDNGECQISFAQPIQLSLSLLLHVGAHRGIKLITDEKPEWAYGIQGPAGILEICLHDSGVTSQVIEEFRTALSER